MFLSDGDLQRALEADQLICRPKPTSIDPTSFDVHLGPIEKAWIWDISRYASMMEAAGHEPELRLGKAKSRRFADEWLRAIPPWSVDDKSVTVGLRGTDVLIRPGGFLLWQTREEIGTPEDGSASLIAFINAKSMKARTGIVVHLTAPTIHSSWVGHVTLEIANLGPFTFVLSEGDAVAQITVAEITKPPLRTMQEAGSVTYGQTDASGASEAPVQSDV